MSNLKLYRSAIFLAISAAAGLAAAYDPLSGDFAKPAGPVIRVLTYNVHNNFIYDPTKDGNFQRVIKAVNPDIIAFQEMEHSLTAAQIDARLVSYFPGSNWNVYLGKADGSVDGTSNRNVIASRYALSMTRQDTNPTSDIRGVTCALIDLPNATFSKDLYFMSIHFKAGSETVDHQKRQEHADAITNWMRDARTAGGNINLPAGTPLMVAGDTNLLNRGDEAPYHATKTMLDGTIYDTARFGASSLPDWDGTENQNAGPYDYNTGLAWTHSSSDPASRIDRFYYTDSQIHSIGGFVLNSRTMTGAARSAAGGILVNDTSGASDHLPVISDFKLGADPTPGRLLINEYNANNIGTDDSTFLEIRNVGGREINLEAPIDYWIKQSDPLPTTVPATENQQYAYDLVGVVPPGGVYVLYSSTGHSSAIAGTIQSRLPALNRQDLSTFVLDNDDNSAIALVQQKYSRWNVTSETSIEALGWASPNPAVSKYFRLDAGNSPVLTLGSAQWTTFLSGGAGSNGTAARNVGDTAANSYAGWTMNAVPTPGLQNDALTSVRDWSIY